MKQENRRSKKQENRRLKALAAAFSFMLGLITLAGIGAIYNPYGSMARAQVHSDSSLITTIATSVEGEWPAGIQPGADKLIADKLIADKLIPDIGEDVRPFPFVFPPQPDTIVRYSGSSSVKYDSVKCVGCHIDSDEWVKSGSPKLRRDRAHHPMGRTWSKTSCAVDGCHSKSSIPRNEKGDALFELDGFNDDGSPAPFDQQIFSCTSCHTNMAVTDNNPSFLRYASFKDDDTAFCEYCHQCYPCPKNADLLKANNGRHFKTRTDPSNHVTRTFKATGSREETVVKCGGCMFCHFVHQNEDDPRVIDTMSTGAKGQVSPTRADIKALMRVPPRELNWGSNWGSKGDIALSSDPLDRYEALCYGCHGDSNIVGNCEKNGSLLNPVARQSHRFACKPVSSNTNANIIASQAIGSLKFPKADGRPGSGGGVRDDYGTVEGQIYCGTCHDVHGNAKPPYLQRLSKDDKASPYEANGFCEQCHCTADNPDPMGMGTTHPVGNDKFPRIPMTGSQFPKQFAGGGSGAPFGITAGSNTTKDGVLCLTCHNVHSAATAWDGAITGEPRPAAGAKGKHGQLLVMDNYSSATGSNICIACHDQFGADGSKQTPYNGHLCEVSGSKKQICANCHIPHGAKGIKIWARGEIQGKARVGVKDLCASCHYQGNKDFPGIQSGLLMGSSQWNGGKNSDKNNINGNVFLGGKSANHVMGNQFRPNIDNNTGFLSTKAEVSGFPFSKDEGFYCGSCHNPHQQPNKDESGHGDYLRFNDKTISAGAVQTHDRKQFCRQCHPKQGKKTSPGITEGKPIGIHASEQTDPQCEACHRPHDGYLSSDNASIFIYNGCEPRISTFDASVQDRNAPVLTFNPSVVPYESAQCLTCHMNKNWPSEWPNAPQLSRKRAHHPMGKTWEQTSCAAAGCHSTPSSNMNGKTIKLDGFDSTGKPLTSGQIFSCTSCHGAHTTDIPGNPAFLRYASFKKDDTAFCEYCHNSMKCHPKSGTLLAAKDSKFTGGQHFKTRDNVQNKVFRTVVSGDLGNSGSSLNDRVKCGGCMFCHFIHQNEQNDTRDITVISPTRTDLRALMRIPPKELNWGSQGDLALRPDPLDRYEAMCYGCHGNKDIVGDSEGNGSLLNNRSTTANSGHSHRFACKPASDNTRANISAAVTATSEQFPMADGQPGAAGGVMDDYGTVEGQIYCGTCHYVHINTKPPYLYRLPISSDKDKASPYQSDPYPSEDGGTFRSRADRKGFCEQCHCTLSNHDPKAGGTTHPVGDKKVPNDQKTGKEFPKKFVGGGSGRPYGITFGNNTTKDGVICLTCHNVHSASTAWDGSITGEPRPAAGARGKHGQLLVMDNYSSAPGSNMCSACHDQFRVDGSKQTSFNGHLCEVSGYTKQVCANCHIPHGAKGIKIWANYINKDIKKETVGVKDLCASCHYLWKNDFPGIQSGLLMGSSQWNGGKNSDKNNINGNVFVGGSANHVMGLQFKPNQSDGSFVSTKAEVIGFPFSKDEGFYCGSCHNPHKQPRKGVLTDESGHGDYLRFNDKTSTAGAGDTHDRKQFCRQCHPQMSKTKDSQGRLMVNIHLGEPTDPQCEACHRPHDGYPSPDPEIAASIFVYERPHLDIFPGIEGVGASGGKGTVMVTINRSEASFTLSGPMTYSGKGNSWVTKNAPVGDYSILFHPIPGYNTPLDSSSKKLINGGTVSFHGNYTASQVVVPPLVVPPLIVPPEDTSGGIYQPRKCSEEDSGELDIEGVTGAPGEEVRIPVRVQNVPGKVSTLGFEVAYDADILTYSGFEQGDLVKPFTEFSINSIDSGRIRAGGYAYAGGISQGASGYLVWLKFISKSGLKDSCYPLKIQTTWDDLGYFSSTGGCVCIYTCDGDVNEDGEITPGDALIAFNCFLNRGPCPYCADVNKSDEVTPADALCIFQKYLGSPSCLE